MAAACFRMGGGLFALDNMAYLPYTEREKCREDFEMGPFVVEFYETRDGQRPAEDFLEREGESDENTGSVFE
ncbi:hypothetical protein [Faecalibacterium duncaniae]|uniref:hypothetical protein n=1 Tax=Faecalibacterium duncaniae (strain DSM 17677 / JCM 31915 / A2-165) TaxID=411483 RepID=UPI00294315F4|nr:hypothetical protein [Faecalibacterium duncaniae]